MSKRFRTGADLQDCNTSYILFLLLDGFALVQIYRTATPLTLFSLLMTVSHWCRFTGLQHDEDEFSLKFFVSHWCRFIGLQHVIIDYQKEAKV